jgi:hypothetical protein
MLEMSETREMRVVILGIVSIVIEIGIESVIGIGIEITETESSLHSPRRLLVMCTETET